MNSLGVVFWSEREICSVKAFLKLSLSFNWKIKSFLGKKKLMMRERERERGREKEFNIFYNTRKHVIYCRFNDF